MNTKDNQQRTLEDILLELMVQNETLDKINTSTLKVVDLITPSSTVDKADLEKAEDKKELKKQEETEKTAEKSNAENRFVTQDDSAKIIESFDKTRECLDKILDVTENSVIGVLKSIEAGISMLSNQYEFSQVSFSAIASDLSHLLNITIDNNAKTEQRERTRILQDQEKQSEMMKLLSRLGAGERGPKQEVAKQKEDGWLAKILGPLGIIGGLLAGFVAGVVVYFTKLFTNILTSLSKMLGIGKFLEKIGLNSKFFTKITEPFKEIFGKIKGFIAPITDFIGNMFSKIGSLFSEGGALGKVGEFFSKIKDTVMKFIAPFVERFKKFFSIGKVFGVIFGRLMMVFDVFMSIKAAVDKFSETGSIGAALETGISELLGRVIGAPLDLLKNAVSWILGKFGFSEAEKFLDSFSFTDLIQEFVGRLVAWGRQTFEMAFQTIVDIWGDIAEKFSSGDIIGGIGEIFRGLGKYLLGLPADLVKNAAANVGEWFGADMGWLRKFSFRKLFGGTNTETEAETAVSPQKSIIAASMEKTAARVAAEQEAEVTKQAQEKATKAVIEGSEENKKSGIWDIFDSAQKTFYDALEQTLQGGSTQPSIGTIPSNVGAEISALQNNTRDLEANSEMAAAAAPAAASKRSSTMSAQSVTYNSNNIPDRTNWMTTPLANWSL